MKVATRARTVANACACTAALERKLGDEAVAAPDLDEPAVQVVSRVGAALPLAQLLADQERVDRGRPDVRKSLSVHFIPHAAVLDLAVTFDEQFEHRIACHRIEPPDCGVVRDQQRAVHARDGHHSLAKQRELLLLLLLLRLLLIHGMIVAGGDGCSVRSSSRRRRVSDRESVTVSA